MEIRIRLRENKALGRQSVPLSVSLLRYAYDPEKRRSKQVVIGTVDRWATELPPELEVILTDAEREEFTKWAAERDQLCMELTQQHHLLHAA